MAAGQTGAHVQQHAAAERKRELAQIQFRLTGEMIVKGLTAGRVIRKAAEAEAEGLLCRLNRFW